jgi:hypothetical protein
MTSYVPGPETEQDKIRECEVTRDLAEKDEKYTFRCIYGEKVFYVDDTKARMPGHIYSQMGRNEFGISKCCEYHFDEMFAEDDEDNA